MTPEEMVKVQDEHIAAENRGDVDAAVATFVDDCFLEIVALGLKFEGKQGVALQYATLFYTFPDAVLNIDDRAFGDDTLVEWGTFTGTMKGEFMGVAPTGRRLELPFIAVVRFKDGLMESERAYYDIASLCDQLEIGIDEVRAAAKLLAG
jgi:steroid delta-isomerase-like uncharacterized protein